MKIRVFVSTYIESGESIDSYEQSRNKLKSKEIQDKIDEFHNYLMGVCNG